jgi:hypothetical protein
VTPDGVAQLQDYRQRLIGDGAALHGQQLALSVSDEWPELAAASIRRHAATGFDFTSDDVIAECGSPPSNGTAGAVFGAALRRGDIEPVGYTTSRRLNRHGGVQRLWRGRS